MGKINDVRLQVAGNLIMFARLTTLQDIKMVHDVLVKFKSEELILSFEKELVNYVNDLSKSFNGTAKEKSDMRGQLARTFILMTNERFKKELPFVKRLALKILQAIKGKSDIVAVTITFAIVAAFPALLPLTPFIVFFTGVVIEEIMRYIESYIEGC